jgi:hypothetical protein
MRSIAEMSPDVGRAANFSGPSIVNSAGLPDVGAGTDVDVDVDVDGAGLLLDAQPATTNATTTRTARVWNDERFTDSPFGRP